MRTPEERTKRYEFQSAAPMQHNMWPLGRTLLFTRSVDLSQK